MSDVVGIDRENVTAWFAEHVGAVTPPLDFLLVAGGRSNLTFKVVDADGRAWVLRRPPTGHVLPTAHDMSREHRIISALGPTPVPVPQTVGLCEDPAVNGAPFYVMEYLDGHVLRDAATAVSVYDDAQRRHAGESLVDVLADLHAVDVDAVGLGDLARREGYIARQLKRWYGQFQSSTAETGRSVPAVDELHDFLAARIPEQGPAAIVHGDYRLDNTMFDDDGNVLGVLDWEICTLGDPLADVGLLMVYWTEPDDENMPLGVAPTATPGFPTRAELRDRYAARSGRDVSELDFYMSFGYWKLACILEGVYTRYAGGSGGGDASGFEGFASQVGVLAEAARSAAASL
jgi:aminoglycoside phosphotransferase (APT) family kinase protein